jgi:hypothetical protein
MQEGLDIRQAWDEYIHSWNSRFPPAIGRAFQATPENSDWSWLKARQVGDALIIKILSFILFQVFYALYPGRRC